MLLTDLMALPDLSLLIERVCVKMSPPLTLADAATRANKLPHVSR